MGYPVRQGLEAAGDDLQVVVAIGDNFQRSLITETIRRKFRGVTFPAIVHEDASVSRFSSIGEGAVVLQKAVLGANAIVGRFGIVNTQASLDHDCHLGDFASLGPGSVVGGGVTIGERSAIGIGAVVKHEINIGRDVVIGACSYVHTDCRDETVYFGTPAKAIKERHKDTPYL